MHDVEHWRWVAIGLPCGRGYNDGISHELCCSNGLYDCVGVEACNVDELCSENRHGECRGRVADREVGLLLGTRRCSESLRDDGLDSEVSHRNHRGKY